ncbi:MAG: hypothetical protein NTX44_09880 [Ignavibacteriales bacterium]|nr:hypothetical protein [Ignavibacteriales bacterium]
MSQRLPCNFTKVTFFLSQYAIIVTHKYYSTTFNQTKYYPAVVKYYVLAVWPPSVMHIDKNKFNGVI